MDDMVVLFMTSRPEWMTFDEYKKLQKLQRKLSKIVKKGRFEWVSKVHPSSSIVSEMLHDNKLSHAETENLINLITKGRTYRKRVVKEDDQ